MRDMTRGSPFLTILSFSLPMLLGNVFQQVYNLTDSVIVGRFVGKEALGSVGATFPIFFLVIALVTGASLGSSILVSQFFGARDQARLRRAADAAWAFMAILAAAVTLLGLLFGDELLIALDTPAELLEGAVSYNRIIFIGTFAVFGYNGIGALMRGMGDSRTPLLLLLMATAVNVLLDLFFVLALGWGVEGVAWATVIAQSIAFFAGLAILAKRKEPLTLRIRGFEWDAEILKKSIAIGGPSGVQQILVATGMMALTRIVNGFGADATTAFTAAGRIDSFAMMPAMTFSMAISTFVGQNVGAGRLDRVGAGLRATLILSVGTCLALTALIIPFGPSLVALFNPDPEVVRIGSSYLTIVSSFYAAFAIMFTFNGALRGVGDTLVPMLNTLLSLWVIRVPLAWLLSRNIGTDGIWWGIPIAWCAGAILAPAWYATGRWRKRAGRTVSAAE